MYLSDMCSSTATITASESHSSYSSIHFFLFTDSQFYINYSISNYKTFCMKKHNVVFTCMISICRHCNICSLSFTSKVVHTIQQ